MIPKSLDKAIKHALAEEEVLKMGGTINSDVDWLLRKAVENVASEIEADNWKPLPYRSATIKFRPAKKESWFSVVLNAFKWSLVGYGASQVAINIIKYVG